LTRNAGTIGISTYAAKSLGDVVFVELPTDGLELAAGDAMGAVESVKSASDIYTPVAGRVNAVNTELEEKPSIINQSPEEFGWIAKLDLQDGEAQRAKEKLMDKKAYDAFSQ
jgi:glycine cleavage system H protein